MLKPSIFIMTQQNSNFNMFRISPVFVVGVTVTLAFCLFVHIKKKQRKPSLTERRAVILPFPYLSDSEPGG